ncbi:MAG: ubiquinol-cytochrome c reductase iron-sulfur subunit [Thermoleophilia bacterium]
MTGAAGNEEEARGHSLWPIGFAVGIACILIGLVISWPAVLLGAAVTIVSGVLWIREAAGTHGPVDFAADDALDGGKPSPALAAAEDQHLETHGRAGFLTLATIGLGGVIGAAVTLPSIGFAVLPSFTGAGIESNPVDLGPLENFPEGMFVITTFIGSKAQGEVSRRTAYIRNNGLSAANDPSFTIIYSRCVHLGCPVQPNGPKFEDKMVTYRDVTLTPVQPAGFGCPCHGGAYDTEGNRTAGPPVRSLDRYAFSIVDGNLVLGKHFSVGTVEGVGADAKISRYGQAYPGVHVDGLERWLYPIPVPGA